MKLDSSGKLTSTEKVNNFQPSYGEHKQAKAETEFADKAAELENVNNEARKPTNAARERTENSADSEAKVDNVHRRANNALIP